MPEITIEEIHKSLDVLDRSGGQYYPSSELAVRYVRFLLAEVASLEAEIIELRMKPYEREQTRPTP